MTTPADLTDDPWLTFISLLNPRARASLNRTQAAVAAVHAAVTNHHWTPQLLAAECSRDLADVHNPGAVITDRLRKATQHPPVGSAGNAKPAAKLPFCSLDCEDRAGWLEDTDGHIIGRCPCRTRPTEVTT